MLHCVDERVDAASTAQQGSRNGIEAATALAKNQTDTKWHGANQKRADDAEEVFGHFLKFTPLLSFGCSSINSLIVIRVTCV